MVALSRWKSGGDSQSASVEPSPGCIVTARPGVPEGNSQPAEVSPRRTRPANATARPGLPDKPAARRTTEQKNADEEHIRYTKQAKKTALKDSYQRISALQANMVLEQEEVAKDRAPVRPKPRLVPKKVEGLGKAGQLKLGPAVNLPAHNPWREVAEQAPKNGDLRDILAQITRKRLAEKKMSSATRSVPSSMALRAQETITQFSAARAGCPSPVPTELVSDDSDDDRNESTEQLKGTSKRQALTRTMAVAHIEDLDDVVSEYTELQTAVGVVEALPNKKIKTEKVGSGNKRLQSVTASEAPLVATTHAVSSRRSRKVVSKSEPANSAQAGGSSRLSRSTKSDLPPELQNDPEDKWSNVVLPCLLLWCGDQANVWTIPDNDLTRVLVAIIQHVYPSFNLNQGDIKHGSAIYNLACQRLARWRNTTGNAATRIVKAFLKEYSIDGMTTTEMAAELLQDQAFAYENFDKTDQLSAFQSPPLLQLLSLTHLQDTIGWVDIPGLDLPSKCDYGIKGALALCTAALERAFQLAATGKLEITPNQDDGEELTVSTRYNQKQPRTLNKATGKSSTKGTAFSLQNWGGQTLSYYGAISN